ncbi:DNA-directed RNA polymerase RPB7 [Trichinella pseudospiralis]
MFSAFDEWQAQRLIEQHAAKAAPAAAVSTMNEMLACSRVKKLAGQQARRRCSTKRRQQLGRKAKFVWMLVEERQCKANFHVDERLQQ